MTTYQIHLQKKPLAGFTVEQLKTNLQRVLKLSAAQVDALYQRPEVVLKKKLSQQDAKTYQAQLARFGIGVSIQAELSLEPIAIEPSDEPETRPSTGPATFSLDESSDPLKATPTRIHPIPPQHHPKPNEVVGERHVQMQFTGTGREYFGIWIVNIVLTILTLGIYSAWAKVRNKQYFYGHSLLDGTGFQYLAKPTTILKGRIIAFIAFVIWSFVSKVSPTLSIALLVLFLPIFPWVYTRSLRFNALNSAYRSVRFNFVGSYWQTVKVVYVWPFVSLITFSLGLPLSLFKKHQFNIENSRYGTAVFSFDAKLQDYYVFGLKVLATVLVAGFLAVKVSPIFLLLGYILAFGFFQATLTNLYLSNVRLGQHRIVSSMSKGTTLWIFFTNSLFIMLTLGLYTPFAKVRMATYRAECTEVIIRGDLDKFVAHETEQVSALGQEFGEMFDMDIAII